MTDGQNGYLCDDTAESLRDVLKNVMDDKETLERISLCAQETIPVPWDKLMVHAVERYERLIALNKEGKLAKKNLRMI